MEENEEKALEFHEMELDDRILKVKLQQGYVSNIFTVF